MMRIKSLNDLNGVLRLDGVAVVFTGFLLMIASLIGVIITGGFGFGWLLLLLVGYTVVVTCCMGRAFNRSRKKVFLRSLFYGILWLVVTFSGSFLIVQGLIASTAQWHQNDSPEYLLVPGAGIIRREPSFTLARRLDAAIDYLNNSPQTKVIVSGGLSDGQLASEAQVMAWYLEKNDISSDRIILEEQASNTLENVLFSKMRLEELYHEPLKEIVIVTSDYHMLRTQMIAKRVGIKAGGFKSPSPVNLYQQYATREFFAIFKSMLLDWP